MAPVWQVCLVSAVALCGTVGPALAFPGRARARRGAPDLWCPSTVLKDGWEPTLARIIRDGPAAWGDSGVPENAPPPWLDKKRFAAGKAFTSKYLPTIAYAHVQALYLLFAVPSVLDVLVYTGNSDTPDEGFSRYYDTINGVLSWYLSNFYSPGTWGFEQMQYVRSLHNLVRRDMNERPDQDAVRNRTRVPGTFSGCPMSAALRRDLHDVASGACPNKVPKRTPDSDDNTVDADGESAEREGTKWMSQYDMAVTQWAFVGPIIQFPEKFGVANATKAQLDGFVHLWEVIGYSLGIEDRFNFCQGGLEPTLRRCREVLSGIVLPNLRKAPASWEYMARCMADGLGYVIPGVGFGEQLANMFRVTLDSPAPSVESLLTPAQRQSTAAYRGLIKSLREDRNHALWRPVSAAVNQLAGAVRVLPKENLRRLRHRPPHRSKDCFPEI